MASTARRRIAVVADAHANSHALRAVLADVLAIGVDETIVLGDMINGLDPAGTLKIAREFPEPSFIKGNAEHYLLTPYMPNPPADLFHVVRAVERLSEWGRTALGPDELAWIASWPEYIVRERTIFVHDTPVDRLDKSSWHREAVAPEFQEMLYHSPGLGSYSIDELGPAIASLARQHGVSAVVAGHTHR